MAEGSVQHWFNHLFAFFIKGARRRGLPEKERDELLFPSILFRFLGMAVFGDPRKFFLEQSAELQVELCRRAGPLGLSPLFYYMLADTLPERWYAAFKQDFYVQSQYDFRYSRALKKVYGGFQVCETPFIPLRRCYFAYCVYPHPAICFREEQDVLFHRPDVEKVFRKFLGHDWKTSDSRHHFFPRLRLPVLMKPGYPALELRWHVLRDSCSFDPEILWQKTVPAPEIPFCRYLRPEAYYLLTVYNMYSDRWLSGCRYLLDLAFLQKKFHLDTALIERLNREWNLNLDLGLCYRLFPTMFPKRQCLFPSDAAVPDEARYIVYRLALAEYPDSAFPALDRSSTPEPPVPEECRENGMFHRSGKKKRAMRKMQERLERMLPQITKLK